MQVWHIEKPHLQFQQNEASLPQQWQSFTLLLRLFSLRSFASILSPYLVLFDL